MAIGLTMTDSVYAKPLTHVSGAFFIQSLINAQGCSGTHASSGSPSIAIANALVPIY